MSDALGHVVYDREQTAFLQPGFPMPQSRDYSEETANKIDQAVRSLLDLALERASRILIRNRALLDRTAQQLLETETLNQPELLELKHNILTEETDPSAQQN